MTLVEELHATGIRRAGSPKKGFRFIGARPDDVARAHALGIPPAWTEVAVSRSPKARVQAVGKDAKGRWQYRYSEAAVREREAKKFSRLLKFAKALPAMRRAIDRDLRLRNLGRERVMAGILRILSTCFMRPGSARYTDANGSFGLSTLRNRHAHVHGDVVEFDYLGKSHKQQKRVLRDRRVARLVRELIALPGRELFQSVGEDGAVVNIRRRQINAYIKEVMGEAFSAKDFRTWAGTMLCACALARMSAEMVEGMTDRRRLAVAAVKETAAHLGNTPAVCKTSYIWPGVLSSFEKGKVMEPYFATVDELVSCKQGRRHAACEAALVSLLRDAPKAPAPAKKQPRRITRLSRRMANPKARKLAQAFLH